MRRSLLPVVACALACWLSARTWSDDAGIAQDLSQRLRTAKSEGVLRDFRIGVNVENGVVWLSGRVTDDRQRSRALDLARRVPGVRVVVNDLEIGPKSEGTDEPASNPTPQDVNALDPGDSGEAQAVSASTATMAVSTASMSRGANPTRSHADANPMTPVHNATAQVPDSRAEERQGSVGGPPTETTQVAFDQASQSAPVSSRAGATSMPASPSYVMIPQPGMMPGSPRSPR
ncbi:MAG TPA: BON domain-containing protein, partial [Pirellulaceae bacterium]